MVENAAAGASGETSPSGIGCWLSTADIVFLEIAADVGYNLVVLDVEHGTLSLSDLDRLVPFASRIGLEVLIKVAGPSPEYIQQALDFGANGVIIPHIGNVEHAAQVCAAAKYPPLGTRSYAGARTVRYRVPDDGYFDRDNITTKCYPMVETAEALASVAAILDLPTVDGIFVGPSDLSLTSGRGRYRFTDADRKDLTVIAEQCRLKGKPWIMPAWRLDERKFAVENGAASIVVTEQQGALLDGLVGALNESKGILANA